MITVQVYQISDIMEMQCHVNENRNKEIYDVMRERLGIGKCTMSRVCD